MTTIVNNPMWDMVKMAVQPVPYTDPNAYKKRSEAWDLRRQVCPQYAWAIASPEAISFVAEQCSGNIVEMGAGTGYWASQLALTGINIVCYDIAPPDKVKNHYHQVDDHFSNTFYPVSSGCPDVLKDYATYTLFLCWPPYDSSMAYDSLCSYLGNKLIYIGEQQGGCTGDDLFFEALAENWHEVASFDLPQWDGIHDCISVYERD